jgi:hypothetical protein
MSIKKAFAICEFEKKLPNKNAEEDALSATKIVIK